MKNLFLMFAAFFSIANECYSQQNYEMHYGISTVNTSIENLLRLDTLTLKQFQSELEGLGYKYYGAEGSGISMVKGRYDDIWRTVVSIDATTLKIWYFKSDASMYNKSFTDELIDNLRKYYIQDIEMLDKSCPQYGFTLSGKAYTFNICREAEFEIIVLTHSTILK